MNQPKFCSGCGAPLSADARFCESCGCPVAAASATSASAAPTQPPSVPVAPAEPAPSLRAVIPYVVHEMGSFLLAADYTGNLVVTPDEIIFALASDELAHAMEEEANTLQEEFANRFRLGSTWRPYLARLNWDRAVWARYRTMPITQIIGENRKNVVMPRATLSAVEVVIHEDDTEILDAIRIAQVPKTERWFRLRTGNGLIAGEVLQQFYGNLVTIERGSNDE